MKLMLGDEEIIEWPIAPPLFYRPLLSSPCITATDFERPLIVNVFERLPDPPDPLAPAFRYRFLRQESR